MCGQLTWAEANARCNTHNASLVSIQSAAVGNFVRSLVGNVNAVWMGLNKINSTSAAWQWALTGESLANYSAWEVGSTQPSSAKCAMFGYSGCGTAWTAANCQVGVALLESSASTTLMLPHLGQSRLRL